MEVDDPRKIFGQTIATRHGPRPFDKIKQSGVYAAHITKWNRVEVRDDEKEAVFLREAEAAKVMGVGEPVRVMLEKSKVTVDWRDPSPLTRIVNERAAEALIGMGFQVWCLATRVGDWFLHTSEEAFDTFLTWEGCRSGKEFSDTDRVYIGHTSEEIAWMLGMNTPKLGEQLRVGRLPVGTSRVIICTA